MCLIGEVMVGLLQVPYELTEDVRQLLVEEFVRLRQQDPAFGAEQFQTQLAVGAGRAVGEGGSPASSNVTHGSVVKREQGDKGAG